MDTKRALSICFLLICTLGKSQPAFAKRMRGADDNLSLNDAIHSFAEQLYRVSADRSGHSANTVVSPFSVFTALAMTSVGARGSTLQQIERTLRLAANDTAWHEKMTKLQKEVRQASLSDDVITEMANMIWVSKGIKVKSDYFRTIANVFQTHVREADFNYADPVRSIVNQRIGNVTRGHIDQLLPPGSLSKETKILLANALYFKGLWLHPFNRSDTFDEPFHLDDGRSVNVPMMHQTDIFRAANFRDLDAKAVFLPYKDERHGLLCVLPNRKSDLKGTESRLFASGYTPTKLLRRMIQRDVNITLPKFKIRFDADMVDALKQMGIVDLFSDNADLSGISSAALTSGLKISKMYHQSTIEVNEGGSEAAAATAFEITPLMGGSWDDFGPIEFRADRPFLFYVVDRDNEQIPLFVGRLNNPLNVDLTLPKVPAPGDKQQRPAAPVKPAVEPTVITVERIPAEEAQEVAAAAAASSHRSWLHKRQHDRIVFPDFDRVRRSDGKPENATVDSTQSKPADNETVDTRVKDSNWFNKPTAPEVLITIQGKPDADKRPAGSSSFNRPDRTMAPMLPSSVPTTRPPPPSDATISFSIFGNAPANPAPPGHPPVPPNGSWGPPNEPPVPGHHLNFPNGPNFAPPPPPPPPTSSPLSIGWYQEHGNENFPQSLQNTGIRFPDFQFSLPQNDRKNSFPVF